jgi:hypothetical protein
MEGKPDAMDKPYSGGKQPFETTDELSAQLRAAEQRIRELEAKVRQLEDRGRAGGANDGRTRTLSA